MDFLDQLRFVNESRTLEWGDGLATPSFLAMEFAGEAGELVNVIKKLVRAETSDRGSKATIDDLEDEIGDVLICLDRIACRYGIDIAEVTARKFNKTSIKVNLPQRLEP
jgi:NTP pyrophosphatase (non-canonical NTP hydrolase)